MALTDKPTTLSGTHQGTGICCNLVENTAGVGFFPWAICRSPLGHLSKEFSRVIVCLLPHAAFKLNSMQEVPPLTRWGANFSNLPQPGALLNLPERKARGGISSPPAGEGAQTAGQAELRVAVARSSALPACPPRSQIRQPSEPLQPPPPRGQPPTPPPPPPPAPAAWPLTVAGAPAVVAPRLLAAGSQTQLLPLAHSSCSSFTPRALAGCGWAPSLAGAPCGNLFLAECSV